MKSFLKPGKTMTYTAPAGGVTVDVPVMIGGLFVVPDFTAAAAAQFEGETEGVFTLSKATGEGALVEGMPLWWDATNLRVTVDQTAGFPIGTVAQVGGALTGDTTVQVRLHGTSLVGRILVMRKRLTIAQINAGASLIPAVPGLKTRLTSVKAIAVGGAVGATTTVDVLGTQATASVKLCSFAQASLTQSAELSSGGAGTTILADGASYQVNDTNTPVTVGKTGANLTTATAVDFAVSYVLEAI